jgi:predicted TIM-barrel fold metal-dependent hydrolase
MNMVSPVAVREVIDCDLHIGLTDTDLLMPYLPDYWREQVVTRGIRGLGLAFTRPGAPGSVRPDWRPATGIAGASLASVQAQALDPFDTRFAIANCLYGGQALLNADQGAAICAATNDWIAAEWLAKDSRLRASIVVPWQLPELAVAEIERWAHDKRFVQVLILVSGDMPLGKRLMWPIYEAAEKYGLPLGIHAGTTYRHAPTGSGWPSYQIEDEASFSQAFQQQLLSLLMEGVFAKFPRLKVVMLESGVTWLPFFFSRIDKLWKGLRMETPWVDRLPSEIVRDQVRFTLQPFDAPHDEDITHKIVDQIGSDRVLLFSTDYPHWHFDGTEAFPPGFDAALRRRMTVDNPLETYIRLSEGLA